MIRNLQCGAAEGPGSLVDAQARHAHPFLADPIPADDRHTPLWCAERLGEDIRQWLVCRTIDRRGCQAHQQRAVVRVRKGGAARVSNRKDR